MRLKELLFVRHNWEHRNPNLVPRNPCCELVFRSRRRSGVFGVSRAGFERFGGLPFVALIDPMTGSTTKETEIVRHASFAFCGQEFPVVVKLISVRLLGRSARARGR